MTLKVIKDRCNVTQHKSK